MIKQMKLMLDVGWVLDLANYQLGLSRWALTLPAKQSYGPLFDRYISIVKPKIHKYHQILRKLDPQQYGFYSEELSQLNLSELSKNYGLLAKFELVGKQDIEGFKAKKNQYQLITLQEFSSSQSNIQSCLYLHKLKYLKYLQGNLQQTRNFSTGKKVVSISSVVIHGKGLALKQLGFPTANLKVSQQVDQALAYQPNGIYLVDAQVEGKGKYKGICSIGTNPHYQDSKTKLVEVYIYHQFDQPFYQSQITLRLIALIRFEGKFQTFDCFLNAMHNDICTGQLLAKTM